MSLGACSRRGIRNRMNQRVKIKIRPASTTTQEAKTEETESTTPIVIEVNPDTATDIELETENTAAPPCNNQSCATLVDDDGSCRRIEIGRLPSYNGYTYWPGYYGSTVYPGLGHSGYIPYGHSPCLPHPGCVQTGYTTHYATPNTCTRVFYGNGIYYSQYK